MRSELFRRGRRYRVHQRIRLSKRWVTVDVVFPGPRLALSIDGCFWHCCPAGGHQPKVNGAYWGPKLQRNLDRDTAVTKELQDLGWTVVRVWEHEPVTTAVDAVEQALMPAMAGDRETS